MPPVPPPPPPPHVARTSTTTSADKTRAETSWRFMNASLLMANRVPDILLAALERTGENRLAAYVPGESRQHGGARLRRRGAHRWDVQCGVEGIELEDVVVRRTAGRRRRTAVIRACRRDLAGARGQRRAPAEGPPPVTRRPREVPHPPREPVGAA